jgi:hypothetical protein
MKIPKSKSQIPNKFQRPKLQSTPGRAGVWDLGFGFWSLFGIWDLDFGMSP